MAASNPPLAYSPLDGPADYKQHRSHNTPQDYFPQDPEQTSSSECSEPQKLRWSDGQPLTTTAAPIRASLSTTLALKLSRPSPHGASSPDSNDAPVQSEKQNETGKDQKVPVVEFKEAAVPVKRFWLLTVS
jgi:hypothetical protein